MGKIELKIGSVVFYNNEQYKIIRLISINQVEIENLVSLHISEYSDSNAGVVPDTFAMRFSRL